MTGPLQVLHGARDVRGLHPEPCRQLPGRMGSASAIFRSSAAPARSSGTPAAAISRSCCRARELR
nr:hypothetical protein [Actinospica acidiphila]